MNQEILKWIVKDYIVQIYQSVNTKGLLHPVALADIMHVDDHTLINLRSAYDVVEAAPIEFKTELDVHNGISYISIDIQRWHDTPGNNKLNKSNNQFMIQLFPIKVKTVPF